MKRSLIITFLLFLLLPGFSQTMRSFSEEPDVFIREVPRLFESVTVPGASVEIMILTDSLSGEWNRNAFTDEEKWQIIRMSNLLLDKRIKPYPRFFNYLRVIMELHARDDDHSYVMGYLSGLERKAEERSIRQIKSYLDIFSDFILEGKLFGNNSFSWNYTDSAYVMEYDSVPRFLFKKTDLVCNTTRDTSVISGSGGIYYPLRSRWEGFGGVMDWSKLGLSKLFC